MATYTYKPEWYEKSNYSQIYEHGEVEPCPMPIPSGKIFELSYVYNPYIPEDIPDEPAEEESRLASLIID